MSCVQAITPAMNVVFPGTAILTSVVWRLARLARFNRLSIAPRHFRIEYGYLDTADDFAKSSLPPGRGRIQATRASARSASCSRNRRPESAGSPTEIRLSAGIRGGPHFHWVR
jgi:hypothetical protein